MFKKLMVSLTLTSVSLATERKLTMTQNAPHWLIEEINTKRSSKLHKTHYAYVIEILGDNSTSMNPADKITQSD